jgi:AcrR family transcriptional regulator
MDERAGTDRVYGEEPDAGGDEATARSAAADGTAPVLIGDAGSGWAAPGFLPGAPAEPEARPQPPDRPAAEAGPVDSSGGAQAAERIEPAAGPADTAAALLAAGRQLFARHGYDGASVRAITAAAGANLGAITYHFGSKKALYNQVVESCVLPLASRVEAALSQPGPVLDRVESVIRAYFEHFAQNPDLPQLMMQELVLGGGPPEAAGPPMRRIYGLIQAALREGQASGEIRAGDPVLLALSVISQPIFPMLVRRPIQAIAGLDLEDERTRERVMLQMVGFARAGLAAGPGPEEIR